MKHLFKGRGILVAFICTTFILAGIFLIGTQSIATQKSVKAVAHQKAHAIFVKKCLSCHVSVADPEKQGRTRDDWHLVVNVMHDYGMDLSQEESEMVIDLLYDLRKGIEREAG